ncbi:MAG: GIY-YIG nuclease family protein [Reyranella sp.]|uniref:GIY-YIG nuclease family protein n=1 Tax=Reyranella sp. TaxID=1929291 RepID=UPI001AC8BE12|nr:GIY-YIG nuclease family protein [Reyranella sp.]MBN9086416.1 GIY-YIG nuclease family protein [Reyranella sp.]
MPTYWTCILTNAARNVIYVGVTNDLEKRVAEHRDGRGGLFTRRYNVHTLVYAEEHEQIGDAIAREKEMKDWRRSKKDALVDDSGLGGSSCVWRLERSLAALGMTDG